MLLLLFFSLSFYERGFKTRRLEEWGESAFFFIVTDGKSMKFLEGTCNGCMSFFIPAWSTQTVVVNSFAQSGSCRWLCIVL